MTIPLALNTSLKGQNFQSIIRKFKSDNPIFLSAYSFDIVPQLPNSINYDAIIALDIPNNDSSFDHLRELITNYYPNVQLTIFKDDDKAESILPKSYRQQTFPSTVTKSTKEECLSDQTDLSPRADIISIPSITSVTQSNDKIKFNSIPLLGSIADNDTNAMLYALTSGHSLLPNFDEEQMKTKGALFQRYKIDTYVNFLKVSNISTDLVGYAFYESMTNQFEQISNVLVGQMNHTDTITLDNRSIIPIYACKTCCDALRVEGAIGSLTPTADSLYSRLLSSSNFLLSTVLSNIRSKVSKENVLRASCPSKCLFLE